LQLEIEFIETNSIPKDKKKKALYLTVKNRQPLEWVSNDQQESLADFNQLVSITSSLEVDSHYLKQLITNSFIEQGIPLNDSQIEAVPVNVQKKMSETLAATLLIFTRFGLILNKSDIPKQKSGKSTHKWSKEVSTIEFYINTRESLATVMWLKRNQMLIKKGAILMKEAPLNKDGSLGFSARTGAQLRHEYTHAITDFITTEDIILKSVNEVGLILYFGGTNSWLEIKDKDGRTLDDWTIDKKK